MSAADSSKNEDHVDIRVSGKHLKALEAILGKSPVYGIEANEHPAENVGELVGQMIETQLECDFSNILFRDWDGNAEALEPIEDD